MFKFIKELFKKEEPPQLQEDVNLNNLNEWLTSKVSNLSLKQDIDEYFKRVNEIKSELYEKIEILQNKEISDKDAKQVDGKVRNVVIGHKNNYVREVGRFTNSISTIHNITSIEKYQEALETITNLNKELDNLASRTQKSYQASQHLFFDQVEPCFKLLGELNKLVKDHTQFLARSKIGQMPEIIEHINNLQQEKEKNNNLQINLKEKEEFLKTLEEKKNQLEDKFNNLKSSQDYIYLMELQKQDLSLQKKRKELENNIFSFFSKLNKPLKKYERIAIDNKKIKPYLENGLKTFLQDSELSIIEILQGLKRNLNGLQFDDRQKKNILELISKSEVGYLNELSKQNKNLIEEEQELKNKFNKTTIKDLINETENSQNKVKQQHISCKQEITELQETLAKDNQKNIITDLQDLIKDIIKIEVNLVA